MVTLTNISAMRSAEAMANSNAAIKTAMERLSTGSRINSASDDAAGLAISSKMNSQIFGISQAIANAADAIGLLSTADGALGEASSLLQRMRELSLKSASGSATATDRTYLNAEYQRLKNEIDRIGSQTQWNGMNLLDGSIFIGDTQFQVGANVNQTTGVTIDRLSTNTISNSFSPIEWVQLGGDISGEVASEGSGNSVSLASDGKTVAIGAPLNDGNGSDSGNARIYEYDQFSENWIQLGNTINGEMAGDHAGEALSISSDGRTIAIGAPKNNGNGSDSGHTRIFQYDSTSKSWMQLGADIDGEAAADRSGYSVSLSADGLSVAIGSPNKHTRIFQYSSASANWVQLGADIDGEAVHDMSGNSVSISGDGSRVAIGAYSNDGAGTNYGHTRIYEYNSASANWVQLGADIDGESMDDGSGGSVSLSGDGSVVAIGAIGNHGLSQYGGHTRTFKYDGASASWAQLGSDIDGEHHAKSGRSVSMSSDGTTLAIGAHGAAHTRIYQSSHNLNVTSVTSLDDAVIATESVDEALKNINSMRATYGSTMNRLAHTGNNLTAALVNTKSSLSKIADADYAKETSNLAASQIMNQGAQSMLAQANVVYPDMVRKLIGE